jgi:D-glycero-D-manno-heptose 1,7-bisphosphate phosphatase
MSRPAVFLDRDGVVVEEIYYRRTGEQEAPLHPDDVRLLPGSTKALARLAAAGFALVVVSNQAAYAKGKTTLRSLWLVHERFVSLLAAEGVTLDGYFYSYGHPDGVTPHFSGPSLDRKPSPYNLFVAAAQLDLDLPTSWMVGDRETDIACAQAAGVRPILVRSGFRGGAACPLADDLRHATNLILSFDAPTRRAGRVVR